MAAPGWGLFGADNPLVTPAEAANRMILPTRNTITSRFGPRRMGSHHGVDLRAPMGTPVKASAEGGSSAGWKNSIYGACCDQASGRIGDARSPLEGLGAPGPAGVAWPVVARSGNTGATPDRITKCEEWPGDQRSASAANPPIQKRFSEADEL